MANLQIQTCDECRKESPRLLNLENRLYCSRDCYLVACKRLFDSMWFDKLKNHPQIVTVKQKKFTIVA
jgi:hypothetical protein